MLNFSKGQPDMITERRVENFWAKVDKSGECWNWTAFKSKGYGYIQCGQGNSVRAHRFSWVLHNGEIPEGMLVCHKCDNPSCVRPDHLFLGTPLDNVVDMLSKGRNVSCPGISNGSSKLTPEQVRAIYLDPRTNVEIGKAYGIASSLASLIRLRRLWADYTNDLPDMSRRKTGPKRSAA